MPLLIRWPGRVQPGTVDKELVQVADFFPTLCELTGAPLPKQSIHGQSFAVRLLDKSTEVEPRKWVHFQMADNRYLRTKNWIVTDKEIYKKVQPFPFDAQ